MLKHNTLELTLGGKVRPMAFDFNFLDYVTEGTDLTGLMNLQTAQPWRFVPKVAMAALQAAADRDNKKDKFTLDQVSEWIMNMEDAVEMAKIQDHFEASLGFIYQGATGKNPFAKAAPVNPAPNPES